MQVTVKERVLSLLKSKDVPFSLIEHEPVYTSEQAARVRGTPLESGAKALVCKANDEFMMFVMPASSKLFTRGVRRTLGIQRLRFATGEELYRLTGLEPGCVPPFGSLFHLITWCDEALTQQPRINFNIGDHAVSVGMAFEDYLKTETPRIGPIAK